MMLHALGVVLLLSTQLPHANTVSLSRLCGQVVTLTPSLATSLSLDNSSTTAHNSSAPPCRIDFRAPPSHHISLLYVTRALDSQAKPRQPCLLTMSYAGASSKTPRTVVVEQDLCSGVGLEYTELLPPALSLLWRPSNDAVASELVFAAVGRGQEVCSRADMFPCIARPHYSAYCVGINLVCDGRPNCPYSGNDEDEALCGAELGAPLPPHAPDTFRLGQGLQLLASEMLRKFIVSKSASNKVPDNSTEKSTVLWFDQDSGGGSGDSLPNVLNHYGPWGYLMLGMLICGTVLMFCGLWECCCRKPKMPATTAGPTLLIINQGAQAETLEVPTTPSPPRYEDLDQPPSYSSLFGKASTSGSPQVYTMDVPVSDTRPKP